MPSLPQHPARRALHAVTLLALLTAAPANAVAQSPAVPPSWTWSDLRTMAAVDTSAVAWLEANVPRAEASALFELIGRLSSPAAVQLLPSLAYLEGSTAQRPLRAFVDTLSLRPPSGAAGVVRVAYLLARTRREILGNTRSTYATEFGRRDFTLPAPPSARPQPGAAVRLTLDFAPAESLLAIVTTPGLSYEDAMRRIATPAFDALITHHGQAFYPIPLTREQLALNLVHAASDQPLDQLYMYARPSGFYHFADVRQNAAQYRRIFDELRRRERDIAAYATAALAPYVPAGTQLDRRVSFYFGDLSDGWGVGSIAAVPIEYYKDNYVRMFNTMVHETFHAAQSAVQTAEQSAGRLPVRALRTPWDTAFSRAARSLLIEGTANYIAPAVTRTPASADSMSLAGARLLSELAALRGGAWNATRAQEILNQGVASGGPFYWLGAAMSRSLVERDGAAAIGRVLRSDGLGFARAYLASRPGPGDALLAPEVGEWVRALTDQRP
jgi:hypothetical protein